MPPKRQRDQRDAAPNRATETAEPAQVDANFLNKSLPVQFERIASERHKALNARLEKYKLRRLELVKLLAPTEQQPALPQNVGRGLARKRIMEDIAMVDSHIVHVENQIKAIYNAGSRFLRREKELRTRTLSASDRYSGAADMLMDSGGGGNRAPVNGRALLRLVSVSVDGITRVQNGGDLSAQRKMKKVAPNAPNPEFGVAQSMHRFIGGRHISAPSDQNTVLVRFHGLDATRCPHCGSSRILNGPSSYLECHACGTKEFHDDVGINAFPHGTDVENTPGYRRQARLTEIFDRAAGVGTVSVPPETCEEVKRFVLSRWVWPVNMMDSEDVMQMLKSMNPPRIDLIPNQIELLYYIKGEQMPRITNEMRRTLSTAFDKAERTFLDLRETLERNNFTYYPTLRWLCILNEYDDLVALFPPLKTREKRIEASNDLRKIAERLGWEFYDEQVTTNFRPRKRALLPAPDPLPQ